MSLVFQYGSNTSAQRLNSPERLNGAATVISPAYTKNLYELDFTVWSKTNKCAAADIVPDGKTQNWGALYEIPDNLIYRDLSGSRKSLDAVEGEGGNYQRVEIDVISQNDANKIITVLTYVVRERSAGLITSAEYASEILAGLVSHDIPKEYVAYVRKRILLNNESLSDKLPEIA
jgi:hypothetical protein